MITLLIQNYSSRGAVSNATGVGMVGVRTMGDLIEWFGSYTTGLILAPCAFLYV